MYTNVRNRKVTIYNFITITSIVTIVEGRYKKLLITNYRLFIFSEAISSYPLILLAPKLSYLKPYHSPIQTAG
jgi:hypothetical protein